MEAGRVQGRGGLSVHGRLLFTGFETLGSGWGGAARSPSGRPQSPEARHWGRPGSGPPGRTRESPPCGASLPTSAVCPSHGPLLRAGGGCRLSYLREASCVSRVLQEPFSALGSWPWAGFSWEAFSSPAWSLCRLTPSPPGTRQSPHLSLINTCEMIPKLMQVFFFIIHFAY